jgi:hypothetical protein
MYKWCTMPCYTSLSVMSLGYHLSYEWIIAIEHERDGAGKCSWKPLALLAYRRHCTVCTASEWACNVVT